MMPGGAGDNPPVPKRPWKARKLMVTGFRLSDRMKVMAKKNSFQDIRKETRATTMSPGMARGQHDAEQGLQLIGAIDAGCVFQLSGQRHQIGAQEQCCKG